MQPRKPLFDGSGMPRRWRREDKVAPSGLMRRMDYIVWSGISVVCLIFVFKVLFMQIPISIPDSPESAASYLKLQGSQGYAHIAQVLAHPDGDRERALRYLKLLPHVDCPELRKQLVAALPLETGSDCLASLGLCLLSDEKGLPRLLALLKETEADADTICTANYFLEELKAENPLIRSWGCDNDLSFIISVVQTTVSHTFDGDTLADRRAAILEWWNTHRNGTVQDWTVEFLASPDADNRALAFNQLYMRLWEQPALHETLGAAMESEPDTSLRRHMATKLFRVGNGKSIPYFDDVVRSAKSPEEISNVLSVFKNFVQMPAKFLEIDAWRDGRDDKVAYQFVVEWWNSNYQFLVFEEDMWYPRGTASAE